MLVQPQRVSCVRLQWSTHNKVCFYLYIFPCIKLTVFNFKGFLYLYSVELEYPCEASICILIMYFCCPQLVVPSSICKHVLLQWYIKKKGSKMPIVHFLFWKFVSEMNVKCPKVTFKKGGFILDMWAKAG